MKPGTLVCWGLAGLVLGALIAIVSTLSERGEFRSRALIYVPPGVLDYDRS